NSKTSGPVPAAVRVTTASCHEGGVGSQVTLMCGNCSSKEAITVDVNSSNRGSPPRNHHVSSTGSAAKAGSTPVTTHEKANIRQANMRLPPGVSIFEILLLCSLVFAVLRA